MHREEEELLHWLHFLYVFFFGVKVLKSHLRSYEEID